MTNAEFLPRILELITVGDIDNADDMIMWAAENFTQADVDSILTAIDGIDHNDMMQILDTLRDNNYNEFEIP